MPKEKDESTELRIKEAATRIFTEKGLAGARMQDIADAAQVNKALVHYYFRNKKQLFQLIFEEKFFKLFSNLSLIVLSDDTFENKIRNFVDREISILSEFPHMPLFVLNELQQNPKIIEEMMAGKPIDMIRIEMRKVFQKEIAAKRIRPVAFEQFMVNLISMCVFPILAKPMLQFMLQQDENAYHQMIEARKKLVADLILNDLLIVKK